MLVSRRSLAQQYYDHSIKFLSFQVNFWFPILKAREAVRKKERSVANDNMV